MGEKLDTSSHKLICYKLKKILDVSEPMDTYILNMGVPILAPNALARVKNQQKTITEHYMDLEFNVCH
jgi:hypothetical protein